MKTTELETIQTVDEWQLNVKIDKGTPFYIGQQDWEPLRERGFYISDEKFVDEFSVATWKVTPKKVNQ